jgi:hypothetical protein
LYEDIDCRIINPLYGLRPCRGEIVTKELAISDNVAGAFNSLLRRIA